MLALALWLQVVPALTGIFEYEVTAIEPLDAERVELALRAPDGGLHHVRLPYPRFSRDCTRVLRVGDIVVEEASDNETITLRHARTGAVCMGWWFLLLNVVDADAPQPFEAPRRVRRVGARPVPRVAAARTQREHSFQKLVLEDSDGRRITVYTARLNSAPATQPEDACTFARGDRVSIGYVELYSLATGARAGMRRHPQPRALCKVANAPTTLFVWEPPPGALCGTPPGPD